MRQRTVEVEGGRFATRGVELCLSSLRASSLTEQALPPKAPGRAASFPSEAERGGVVDGVRLVHLVIEEGYSQVRKRIDSGQLMPQVRRAGQTFGRTGAGDGFRERWRNMESGGQEGHSHFVLSGSIPRPTSVANQQLEHDDNTTFYSSLQHGEDSGQSGRIQKQRKTTLVAIVAPLP